MLEILDSVTLQKLQSLKFSEGRHHNQALAFSPDSHVLTSSSTDQGVSLVVSWDLQTGGVAGVIRHESPHKLVDESILYSTNGKMIAVLRYIPTSTITISIYDVVSYKHMHDVHSTSNAPPCGFWIHGESLRFAAIVDATSNGTGPMSMTVWEVGFTLGATKTEVETFSIPESFKPSEPTTVVFPHSMIYPKSPSAPLLVTNTYYGNDALIWDARNSKILLRRHDVNPYNDMAFSSDGRYFAGSFSGSGVYIWKHSPTGYVPHGKLSSSTSTRGSRLIFSPNGESVILCSGSVVNLWHTKNFNTPLSDSFVDPPRQNNHFLSELSLNKSFAAVVRHEESTVTLFDIRSGAPRLTIDAGGKVVGLGVREDVVAVISDNKVITWKLPGRSFLPGATMSVADRTLAVVLPGSGSRARGCISPDIRFAVVGLSTYWSFHSATTGELRSSFTTSGSGIWFTPDGHNIAAVRAMNKGEIRKITAEGVVEKSATMIDIGEEQWGCPYKSFRGYRIAGGGWIFGPNEKRLLILPPLWRSYSRIDDRKWNGQFLALLHGALPEPVLIDLEP